MALAVKKSELADILGYSAATVTNYCKEGMPKVGTGVGAAARYSVAACHRWIVERAQQKAQTNKPANARTLDDAKYRREEANAVLVELEVAQALKEVVSRTEAVAEVEAWSSAIVRKIQTIPSSWATFVVGIGSAADAIDILTIRANKLLDDLSTVEPDDYDAPVIDIDDDEETE